MCGSICPITCQNTNKQIACFIPLPSVQESNKMPGPCQFRQTLEPLIAKVLCRASLQEKKKNTLAPVWQERKFLMVQEPTTQFLRLEMFDWDRINAKELLTLNLVKVTTCSTQGCVLAFWI